MSTRVDGQGSYRLVSSITNSGVPAHLKFLVNGAGAETTYADFLVFKVVAKSRAEDESNKTKIEAKNSARLAGIVCDSSVHGFGNCRFYDPKSSSMALSEKVHGP